MAPGPSPPSAPWKPSWRALMRRCRRRCRINICWPSCRMRRTKPVKCPVQRTRARYPTAAVCPARSLAWQARRRTQRRSRGRWSPAGPRPRRRTRMAFPPIRSLRPHWLPRRRQCPNASCCPRPSSCLGLSPSPHRPGTRPRRHQDLRHSARWSHPPTESRPAGRIPPTSSAPCSNGSTTRRDRRRWVLGTAWQRIPEPSTLWRSWPHSASGCRHPKARAAVPAADRRRASLGGAAGQDTLRVRCFGAYRSCGATSRTCRTNASTSATSRERRTRFVDGGRFARQAPGRHSFAGRIGRGANPPPQFGQTLWSLVSTQSAQNVHS